MKPLYEIVRHRAEFERLAESEDLPPELIADTLESLDGELQDKATNVAAFTRNLESSAAAIREAGKAMLARADRLEKRADSIRQYLLLNMQVAGITKIECPWFTIAVRKNPPSVVIDDESALPPEYVVQPPPPAPRPDKAAIGRALKAGDAVPGAHLVQSERLEVKE